MYFMEKSLNWNVKWIFVVRLECTELNMIADSRFKIYIPGVLGGSPNKNAFCLTKGVSCAFIFSCRNVHFVGKMVPLQNIRNS